MQGMQPATARDNTVEDDGEPGLVAAFAGRVFGAFVTLVVLAALALAMVALAYWSKRDAPALHSPPSGPGAPATRTF